MQMQINSRHNQMLHNKSVKYKAEIKQADKNYHIHISDYDKERGGNEQEDAIVERFVEKNGHIFDNQIIEEVNEQFENTNKDLRLSNADDDGSLLE